MHMNDDEHVNDMKFEKRLTSSLYRAAELDYMDIPSGDELEQIIQPSASFQRKMQKLLGNPQHYAKSHRKPIYFRILRTAAAILITFSLLLSGAMLVSPAVSAALIGFVRTWFEDKTEYRTIEGIIYGDWTIGYIPEGFELSETITNDHLLARIYIGKENERISISISGGQGLVDNEHSTFYQTTINGRMSDVYEAISDEYNSMIIMYDEPTGFIIALASSIDLNELIKVAESIDSN